MLEQQFYSDTEISLYLHKNFIPFISPEGSKEYGKLRSKYQISGLPKDTIVKPNGELVDKLGNLVSNESYLGRIKNSVNGTGTLSSLEEDYDKNPGDMLTSFKLVMKYREIYKSHLAKPILEDLYKNKAGLKALSIPSEDGRNKINAYEYSRYLLGTTYMRERSHNAEEFLIGFIEEYSESEFKLDAVITLAQMIPEDSKYLSNADKYAKYLIKEDPENTWARKQAARLYLITGKEKEAFNAYGYSFVERQMSQAENDRDKAEALNDYAWYWAGIGKNLESARKAGELALEYMPDKAGFMDTLSLVYKKLGKLEKALKLQKNAYALSNESGHRGRLIEIYLAMGDENKAIKVYDYSSVEKQMSQAEDDRGKASALNSFAWFWAGIGKNLESARKASELSLEYIPDSHGYMDTLSLICWKLGDLDTALRMEEKALELSPNSNAYKQQIEKIKKDMKKIKR